MSIDTIQSSIKPVTDSTIKKPAKRPAEEAQAAQKPAGEAFTVSISSSAGQKLEAAASEEEIRRAKVAAIREQLAAGSYNISGKDVAAKILNALKS